MPVDVLHGLTVPLLLQSDLLPLLPLPPLPVQSLPLSLLLVPSLPVMITELEYFITEASTWLKIRPNILLFLWVKNTNCLQEYVQHVGSGDTTAWWCVPLPGPVMTDLYLTCLTTAATASYSQLLHSLDSTDLPSLHSTAFPQTNTFIISCLCYVATTPPPPPPPSPQY